MTLDIFRLHVPAEDTTLRRCLRVYTILPKYCKNPTIRNTKAIPIVQKIRNIDQRLVKKTGFSWRKKWAEKIGYPIKQCVFKDWFCGRASIPLIAIEKLKFFIEEKELTELAEQIDYVSSTTQEVIRIPKELSPDLLYLTGILMGDGCFSVKKYGRDGNNAFVVILTSSQKEFLQDKVSPIFFKLFEINRISFQYKDSHWPSWDLRKANKALYRFFVNIIGIPSGKKSEKACIPDTIKQLPVREQIPFISGLIDSDIGKHGRGMGCTFRSKRLIDDLLILLEKNGVEAKYYGTHLKNGKYIQNDFSIPKSQIKRLKDVLVANYLPKREDRLNLLFSLAGIGERSNLPASGSFS